MLTFKVSSSNVFLFGRNKNENAWTPFCLQNEKANCFFLHLIRTVRKLHFLQLLLFKVPSTDSENPPIPMCQKVCTAVVGSLLYYPVVLWSFFVSICQCESPGRMIHIPWAYLSDIMSGSLYLFMQWQVDRKIRDLIWLMGLMMDLSCLLSVTLYYYVAGMDLWAHFDSETLL